MSSPPPPIHKDNTAWIFVSGSKEPRHLYDVVLGIDALRHIGYEDKNIFAFVDNPKAERDAELAPYEITSNVFETKEFATRVAQITGYEHAVVVITGHGCDGGLSTDPIINPNQLLNAVRSIKGIKDGVVVLGQCFAGLFNFTDAAQSPPVTLMGATNLNPSLSIKIELQNAIKTAKGEPGLKMWQANIFLFYFFEWLRAPADVDGDGSFSIIDAYRYAGIRSNAQLIRAKYTLDADIDLARAQQRKILALSPKEPNAEFLLRLHALQKGITDMVETLYLHQESWILHANLARAIQLKRS